MRLNYGFPAPSLQENEKTDTIPAPPPDDRRVWDEVDMTKEEIENKRRRSGRSGKRR